MSQWVSNPNKELVKTVKKETNILYKKWASDMNKQFTTKKCKWPFTY